MFEHLKKLDVRDSMAWMDFPEIGPGVRLLLKPAGEMNPAYHNAMIRFVTRGRRVSSSLSAEDLKRHRQNDRGLFPLYIIAGWEGVMDSQGQPVGHSRDAAKELCEQLPDWLFDKIRNFAAQPENFLPEGEEEPLPSAEEVAGN